MNNKADIEAVERFLEALKVLQTKIDDKGQVIVERPNRKLAGLSSFAKSRPSEPATRRYLEILANLERANS